MRRELREPSKFFSAWTLNPFSNHACLGNLSRRTVEIPQQSLQNSACIANQYVDTIFPLKDRCTVAFSILWNQKVCQWTWSNRELEAVRITLCLRSLLWQCGSFSRRRRFYATYHTVYTQSAHLPLLPAHNQTKHSFHYGTIRILWTQWTADDDVEYRYIYLTIFAEHLILYGRKSIFDRFNVFFFIGTHHQWRRKDAGRSLPYQQRWVSILVKIKAKTRWKLKYMCFTVGI